ncbi:unnamed protein product [Prorocentrum cordatum]|uniref:Uncharacterized protein n=1 Tax=Prorocentrum cordatum TaxID=2364126 RepID=A0ABN9S596_9DINO|nr:unnamed protein product [Polarella glacialis]
MSVARDLPPSQAGTTKATIPAASRRISRVVGCSASLEMVAAEAPHMHAIMKSAKTAGGTQETRRPRHAPQTPLCCEKVTTGGFSPLSASRGPHSAPGPSKNSSG